MAFVINDSCYFSVIFRGGIEGVPAGQREAGQVLGMTKHHDIRKCPYKLGCYDVVYYSKIFSNE